MRQTQVKMDIETHAPADHKGRELPSSGSIGTKAAQKLVLHIVFCENHSNSIAG